MNHILINDFLELKNQTDYNVKICKILLIKHDFEKNSISLYCAFSPYSLHWHKYFHHDASTYIVNDVATIHIISFISYVTYRVYVILVTNMNALGDRMNRPM